MLRDFPKMIECLALYYHELSRRHGETVLIPMRYPTYLISNPEDVRHVLLSNPRNYHKSAVLTADRAFFGEGLLSCEAPAHTVHRKMIQPIFHRGSIARLVDLIGRLTATHLQGWRPGATLDIATETMTLALTVAGHALFGVDVGENVNELGEAFVTAQRLIRRRLGKVPIPLWAPTPANARYRGAIATMNRFIGGLIEARMKLETQPADLLGMLVDIRYEDGSRMSQREIRDEVATFLFAGHETVSNHLNWTWYLVSRHPEVEARLEAEWESVLGGAIPTLDQIPQLRYTAMVMAESLRLYPPVWTLARWVVAEDRLPSGLALHPPCEVHLSQYVSHRNPALFPDPERFDPGRWTREFEKALPAGVYYPFGAGSRNCIGEQFARTEAALVLAAVGQRFRLRLAPGQTIGKQALMTLRPRHGLKMELVARG
jgi:cytochrome P450